MSPALGRNTILTLREPQDGAKIDPRSAQDGLKIDLKRDRFLRRFYDRFLVVLGSVLAPFWGAKTVLFGHLVAGQIGVTPPWCRQPPSRPPKRAPRPPKMPPRPPKMAKMTLQTTKNDPNRPPRRAKMIPIDLQDDKTRQEKTSQDKTRQDRTIKRRE